MALISEDLPNKAEIFKSVICQISENVSPEETRIGYEAFLDALERVGKQLNPTDTTGATGRYMAIAVLIDRMNDQELRSMVDALTSRLETPIPSVKEETKTEVKAVEPEQVAVDEPDTITDAITAIAQNEVFKQCIKAIASACDGAGFNKPDSSFGKWAAKQFDRGMSLTRKQATAAHRMMVKYKKQLGKNALELPAWEEIEPCYPENAIAIAKPEKRLEMRPLVNQIAVFTSRAENQFFKSIGYITFDWDEKAWKFEASKIVELVERAEQIGGYHLDLGCHTAYEAELERRRLEEEARQRKAIEAASQITQLVEVAKLDQPIACGWKLFEHQAKGAEWLLAHGKAGIYKGGILADQMGLGKTIEALVAAKAVKEFYNCHAIVICPPSLKDNWLIEAEKVGVKIDVYSWAKMPLPLEMTQYIVIADEAHYAQNPSAARTKNLWTLTRHDNCLYTWLLTGTPLKNGRPINLFPLLYAVDHPLSRDRRKFEKTYCQATYRVVNSRGQKVYDTTGASCLDDLAKQTQDVILQRKKHDCLDLPEKLRSKRPVELDSSSEAEYDREIQEAVEDFRRRAAEGLVDADAEVLVTLQLLRRIGSKYKAEAAIATAQELLEAGEQVVIFTEFLESAKAIASVLSESVQVELLTGDVDASKRQGMVERFQSGESKVFVGTTKAGGVGITLTAASYVILVDRPWSPGDVDQAEDRCHRIGQKNTVIPIWLQLSDIDTMIDALLEQKQHRIDLVMKGKRKTLRGIGSIQELAKELIAAL